MKFIYNGDYATRDGVTFMFRNPTTVENKATIERLMKDPEFTRYEPVEEPPALEPEGHACTKCGRVLKQGWFLHEKHCRGPS